MNYTIPSFCAFVANPTVGIACGEAIVNGEESYIIHNNKEDRWYEAVRQGSLFRVASYMKIQEVFWNTEIGEFVS